MPSSPAPRARRLRRMSRRLGRAVARRRGRLVRGLYYSIVPRLSWWPIAVRRPHPRVGFGSTRRIAYYTWHFPVLSQTFVHRELAALRRAGVDVEIFADEAEDLALADDNARWLLGHAHYLYPLDRQALARYRVHFFLHRPITCLRLLVFVLTHRYARYKSLGEDWRVFEKSLYLAGVMRDRAIDHVHSPWADLSAFVALVASRLLDVPYSVQARAHDLYRHSSRFGLRDRFEHAEFVVTNTEYNRATIATIVGDRHHRKIAVIHNGVDLHRFSPGAPTVRGGPIRVLSVARLIEQKGLTVLLRACDRLRRAGVEFRCEIVGDAEEPLYTNYFIALKRLHRRLGLEDSVVFLGPMPFADVLARYADAGIFVLPSLIAADGSRDVTPNALIEAMAMKLPVVSTRVAGIPEIVDAGVNGLLVEPGDEPALARALQTLIEQPDLRRRLGEEGRRKVEEKFDIERNVRHFVTLFGGSVRVVPIEAEALPIDRAREHVTQGGQS